LPTRLKRPCSHHGCPNLTAERFCEQHKKQEQQRQDRYRGTANERGYGVRWQRARLIYLREHPLCAICMEQGLITAGEVVDHIIPHKGDYELFWDETNWQTLCKRCHDVKTATEDGGFGATPRYRPNNLLPSLVSLTIICGPPGSGKSTLANERANGHDLVIDLDAIKAQLTGTLIYERQDEKAWNAAIVKRNQILYDLGRKRIGKQAFFIIGAPTIAERQWWREALKPVEVIVLETPIETCIERIKADDRRPPEVKLKHIEAVKSWWQRYKPENLAAQGI